MKTKVISKFREIFATEPICYFSPGRINLIGEHIDYNDGFVLPAAIDKGVYYAIAANDRNIIQIHALDFDESITIKPDSIKKTRGWANYPLSVINELLLLKSNLNGFDCVFSADVPRGSGMSSSAAVEGGLAFALNKLFSCGLDRKELAILCQRAEHNFPGVHCGIMDLYANMLGKKDHVLLLDCKSITHEYIPIALNEYSIVMVNSMVHHSLAAGEYNIRRKDCEEGIMILKEHMTIYSFRDIIKWEDLLAYRAKMGEQVYMRCLYVVEEILRTRKAAELLKKNDIIGFGKLMFETHEGLRDLYHVSCNELDFLVEEAKKQPGIIGARLMGGGFGGCTINLVETTSVDHFIKSVCMAYEKKYFKSPECYIVKTGDGTRRLD